ncbi:MAG: alpha/beta hydrolase [Steroidobacteraceae bacterium]|nr:alpha/beta hydrolase [Steroidobacteraceae bacterium]MDW8259403.1 YqiA/YcfP family alpha/beta fold hydrolase [Gammaproteobacteria bacterium]
MATDRHVVFSHGKESGPWGSKITALAETARSEGYAVESIDYQGIDSPAQRIEKLVESCQGLRGDLVLVGSSLGGYVSLAAAALLHARALFLMAPAIYLDGLPPLRTRAVDCPTAIVHGWRDAVVPVEHSIRFAREHAAALHVVDDDHRLQNSIREIRYLFEYFLIAIDLPPPLS